MRHLDSGHADTARATLHQQGLAFLQLPTIEHIAPHREECLRQAGGLRIGQTLGSWQALTDRRDAIFGVTTTGNQGTDTIAKLESRIGQFAGVTLIDHACDFETGNIRGSCGYRIVARSL